MTRSHFASGLTAFVWLLSACQSPQNRMTEGGSSSLHVFCDGHIAWSADVTTDDMINYTTFWIAIDTVAAHDIFKYIHVDVTLDGEPLSHEMKYVQAAEAYSVNCTDSREQFEASRVKYTLFLPPLAPEEHVILWKYTIPAYLNDEVFGSPSGLTAEYEFELHLIS